MTDDTLPAEFVSDDCAQFAKGQLVYVRAAGFREAADNALVWVSEDPTGNRGCFCFKADVKLGSISPCG